MIPNENKRNEYTGDGTEDTFAYTFRVEAKSEIQVLVDNVVKTLDTHYTIDAIQQDAGGNVIFNTAPVNGAVITILLAPAITQLVDYSEGSPFPAETHERALDKLTRIGLMLTEKVGRALKFQKSSLYDEITVPDPENNTVLGWQSGVLVNLPSAAAGAPATAFQVNGTPTASQATINFINGIDATLSNPSVGQVKVDVASIIPNYAFADVQYARGLVSRTTGNFTVGVGFCAIGGMILTGFKFAWDGFAAKTIKWTVWDAGYDFTGSTSLQTATIAVSAAGVYTVTLAPSLTLVAGKTYVIAVYVNDGSVYPRCGTLPIGWTGQTMPMAVGLVMWRYLELYIAGDGKPNNTGGTDNIPIQLVYSHA